MIANNGPRRGFKYDLTWIYDKTSHEQQEISSLTSKEIEDDYLTMCEL
jgi:hypothetical protein